MRQENLMSYLFWWLDINWICHAHINNIMTIIPILNNGPSKQLWITNYTEKKNYFKTKQDKKKKQSYDFPTSKLHLEILSHVLS